MYYFGARYYDPRTSVWQSADPILGKYLPVIEDGKQKAGIAGGVFVSLNLNFYAYAHQNPVRLKDPDGNFVLYVETTETGHIGIQTNYNGSMTNYDFGRYKGTYTDSWVYGGPAVNRRTKGKPSSAQYGGYQEFNFKVSQKLDNAIALKFRKGFDSGQKQFPDDIKKRLPAKKQVLGSNERYTGEDWGLNRPGFSGGRFV